jgi:tol-pal system protein YbgF
MRSQFMLGRWLPAALLLGALASPGQAALFSDDEARKAILDLRERVSDLEKQQSGRADELAKRIERLESALEAAQRGQIETANQIESLRQDIAKLRGLVEQVANDVATLQKRNRDLYGDLDQRLRKLEPQTVTVEGKNVQMDREEQSAYDTALAQFRASDFRSAINSLQAFIARYPQSVYAVAAQFWLGSSYYAIKDFRSAIAAQQTLVDKYPDSPRVPEALLNIAASQIELNDKKSARVTLNRVVTDFPDADAAKLAKDRLAALGPK